MFARFNIVLLIVAFAIPSSVISAQTIQITTTGGGSINNTTTSVSEGGDAHTSAQVKNILGSDGTLDVQIETEINGVIEQKNIQEKIEGGVGVDIRVESTRDASYVDATVGTNVIASSTKEGLGVFERWRKFFSSTDVDDEVSASAKPNDRENEKEKVDDTQITLFSKIYTNIIGTLQSIFGF